MTFTGTHTPAVIAKQRAASLKVRRERKNSGKQVGNVRKQPFSFSARAKMRTQVWRDAPAFAAELFGKPFYSKQAEIHHALTRHRQVCVPAANSVGKTFVDAALGILWLLTHGSPSYVIYTSSSSRGIEHVLFPEVKRLIENATTILSTEVPLAMSWKLGSKWAMYGISATRPENFAGYHNEAVLVIIDEASALEPAILEAIQGICVGPKDRILMTGNPLRPSGPFFKATKSSQWKTIRITAFDSPNVTGECEIEGLATLGWINEMKEEWGENSPQYAARILAMFPTESELTVVPLVWIDAAKDRYTMSEYDPETSVLGADIARSQTGDRTALVLRDATAFRKVWTVRGYSIDQTVDWITQLQKKYSIRRISVDDGGLGGGVTDYLKRYGVKGVFPFISAARAVQPTRFINMRAEAGWELRKMLDPTGPRPMTIAPGVELGEIAEMQLKPNWRNLIQLEEKGELKKRLGQSPDIADAAAMACTPWLIAGTGITQFDAGRFGR